MMCIIYTAQTRMHNNTVDKLIRINEVFIKRDYESGRVCHIY